jgi:hypothetical protein
VFACCRSTEIVLHTPQIVTPTRRFVKQGKLVKITSRFVKETLFYLFNDVLIYGYEVMGSYIFKGEIPMGTTWVRDLPNTERTFIILVIRRCCRYCSTMPARALLLTSRGFARTGRSCPEFVADRGNEEDLHGVCC